MTLYEEVVSEVVAITGRPDLITENAAAIRKATLKLHLAELWPRDLVEILVTGLTPISAGSNKYAIDITAAPFARFKQAEYFRNSSDQYGVLTYDILEAIAILDGYGVERPRYSYLAGSSFIIRSDISIATIEVGYYQRPDLSPETYNSWIAQTYINAIADEAASYVFKAIGKDDEFQRHKDAYKENYLMLQALAIV